MDKAEINDDEKILQQRNGRQTLVGAGEQHSNALDLENNVFRLRSPRQIALSLRRSAEASRRRKGTPFQSAMSMLNFYLNRAGKNLSPSRRQILGRAKDELRDLYKD